MITLLYGDKMTIKYKFTSFLLLPFLFLTGCGGSSSSSKVTPEPSENDAPIVSISGDTQTQENSSMLLEAHASDSDGSVTQYSWSVKSGDNITLSNANTAQVLISTPTVEDDTRVIISVMVTDNQGATSEADFQLTILNNEDNQAPSVTISGVAEADEQTEITLHADAVDEDGNIASYHWQVIEGDKNVRLIDEDKAKVRVIVNDVTQNTHAILAITVTDNNGAKNVAQHRLEIIAKTKSQAFTINGQFHGVNQANATIVASIADKTFTALTNAQGEFNLTINLDDSYNATPVKLLSESTSSYVTGFNYTSQLLELGDLKSLAGSDNLLTANEYSGVNIGSLSTINYFSAKNNSDLSTSQEIIQSNTDTSVFDNYLRSGLLKMLNKGNNGAAYPLPKGIGSLNELLSNNDLTHEYSTRIHDIYSTASIQEMSALFNNETLPFSSITQTTHLLFSPENAVLLSIAREYTLNQDGSGSVILENGNQTALTWVNQQGVLKFTYHTPITLKNDLGETNDDVTVVQEQIVSSEFRYLMDKGNAKSGILSEVRRHVNDAGQVVTASLERAEFGSFFQSTVVLSANELIGSWAIDDMFSNNQAFSDPAIVTLESDGTGSLHLPTIGFLSDNLSWQIKNNSLIITASNGEKEVQFTYFISYQHNNNYSFVAHALSNGEQTYRNGVMHKLQSNSRFSEDSIAGRYKKRLTSTPAHYSTELFIYNDGIARTSLNGDDHIIRVDESGILYFEQFKNLETNETCTSLNNGSCTLMQQEVYRLLSQNEDGLQTVHTIKVFDNQGEVMHASSMLVTLEKQAENNLQKLTYELLPDLSLAQHHLDGSFTQYTFIDSFFIAEDEEGEINYGLWVDYPNGEYQESSVYLEHGIAYFTLANETLQMSIKDFDRDTLTVCLHKTDTTCTASDTVELDLRYNNY